MENLEKNDEREINALIIERIKKRRKQLKLSYQELSERTGISKSTLQRYESGTISSIPLNKINALSEGLRTTPQYIMGLDDESTGVLTPTDDDIIFALFDGTDGVTPEMYDEVKIFAGMVKLREKHKKRTKDDT